MALLTLKKGSSANLNNVAIKDGQLLVTTDTKKIYLDNGSNRLDLYSSSLMGGYNLCYDTDKNNSWHWAHQTGTTTSTMEVINGTNVEVFTRDNVESTGWKYLGYTKIDLDKLEDNREYYFSFEVWSSIECSINFSAVMTGSALNPLTTSVVQIKNTIPAATWTTCIYKFTTNIGSTKRDGQILYLTPSRNDTGMILKFKNPCLVRADFASGYTSIESKYTYLNNNNYTDYTVTKTGVGASGLWNINVAGFSGALQRNDSASNARLVYTKANSDSSYHWGQVMYDANNNACYVYYSTSKNAEAPTIIVYGPDGGTSAIVLTTANYTSYVPTKTGSGASGTWGISITGNAATATKSTQDGNGNIITSTYLSNNPYLGYFNLLPCQDFGRYGIEKGWKTNGSALSIDTSVCYNGYASMKIDTTSSTSGAQGNNWIRLKRGTYYTYSCMMYSTIAFTFGSGTPLHCWTETTKTSGHLEIDVSHYNSTVPANTWTRVHRIIQTPSTADGYWFLPFFYGLPSGGAVYVSQVSLVEGKIVPEAYSTTCIGDAWYRDDAITNAVWN